ncbi:MAG: 16S rRNA (cytidine(1402)-2'-O)-methyltransferase [Rhodopseudomonas sp.]|nr:16S rRNA (cytidine(1402)-2'-O)-methyltransferase [Rhodopseudomonas sp.]
MAQDLLNTDPTPDKRGYTALGVSLEARAVEPGLYLVATPIGNLGDISLRALETLAAVDCIACEDTRVTRKLAERFGFASPLMAYHEHNSDEALPKIIDRLDRGQSVALVSDAGTPLISDPGYRLVRAVVAAGHNVTALPGASAVLTALALSGLPTDRFFFEGFLPPKQQARQKRIGVLKTIPATLVLFESGPRLAASLADLAAGLGPREAAVCRELTKLHEEIRRTDLSSLAQAYAEGGETRGEIVIVIAPPPDQQTADDDIDEMLRRALARVSVKDAVGEVALATGRARRDVYQRALELSKTTAEGDDSARD